MTTTINASLFAHIENDANLSGTFKLEGNHFGNTVKYMHEYLEELKKTSSVPPDYIQLLNQLHYLTDIEKQLTQFTLSSHSDTSAKIDALGISIAKQLEKLKEGESILLPGGWVHKDGGHAMVYQITRKEDGYDLTAFNAGGGLEFHEKKSGLEKELYNPTKTWHFPEPTSETETNEVGLFIGRLFKALVLTLPEHSKKPYSAKRLYKETLASISYIGGEEVPGGKIPGHAYTGGQLSGTCSQRCLHQMLKIMSKSGKDYELFIFKFKQHALFEYATACLEKRTEPYTASVKEQINLAIENNLKILNSLENLSEKETKYHLAKFAEIKEKLNKTPFTKSPKPVVIDDPLPKLVVKNLNAVAVPPSLIQPTYTKPPKPIDFGDGKNFLSNLEQAVKEIKLIADPVVQYYHLEKLLTALPLEASDPFYTKYDELKYLHQYEAFGKQIDEVQTLLQNLQTKWLKDSQIPSLQIMTLCTATIQMNIEDTIARTKKLPSFMPFIEYTMRTLVGNHSRDPFYATNHPALDNKFKQLQKRFPPYGQKSHTELYNYFKDLLATESTLNEELKLEYQKKYGNETSTLHAHIRTKGLQSLFIISQNLIGNTLDPKFQSLVTKVKNHLDYEVKLRAAINPFFKQQFDARSFMQFTMRDNELLMYSPLYASFIAWQELSTEISKGKYALQDSPARDALMADVTSKSFLTPLEVKSANAIQLNPVKPITDQKNPPPVTQADIIARDYFHLRSEPSLQVLLTIDYFTRNIDKLANESDQRYVEANLFQPGLLSDAFEKPTFLPQFDKFLQTGFRFYDKEGQLTRESLFFIHINYQVSRYLALAGKAEGHRRLADIQVQLLKQLALPNTQEVTYVLQQHLFLTLMTQIELGDKSEQLFARAFEAYYYIQSHANPSIFEDSSHRLEVDKAIAQFQIFAMEQSPKTVKSILKETLAKHPSTQSLKPLEIDDKFPVYKFQNETGNIIEANILLGKLFEKGLARAGVPFTLQNHPLIKRLGLQHIQDCLMSADGKYMVLGDKTDKVYLYYNNDKLTVQKVWEVQGKKETYELVPLTNDHLAKHANSASDHINPELPQVLIDDTMDFWRPLNYDKTSGLLIKNNVPIYSVKGNTFYLLDEKSSDLSQAYTLTHLDPKSRALINAFESNQFIVTEKNPTGDHTVVKLPRYNITLERKPNETSFVHQETGEHLVQASPIHASVAGMVLTSKDDTGNTYSRYLIPVARFYATEQGAEVSDFYPVVHDTQGVIAKTTLEEEWNNNKPKQKPLWDYQNSEKYVSLRMQNGEPVADTVADALYLAYIYLATHQPEKAWKILEDCNTRLGGLTGDPAELQYIQWICNELPHLLPGMSEDAIKKTPPYVACKLKAVNLACDFLLQDRKFDLVEPQTGSTANATYAKLTYERLENFQKQLPNTIYNLFSRLQTMHRYMPHSYALSMHERKRLLDYYHQTQERQPLGTLGYEWLKLSLETILQEKETLLARAKSAPPSEADIKRLALIDKHLKKFKAVNAKSSILELVPLDLSLPTEITIKRGHLPFVTKTTVEDWENKLPGDKRLQVSALEPSVKILSSDIKESTFLINFPAYFQIALFDEDPQQSKRLLDFCRQTLIAHRHVPLADQESNVPLLCNILYRIAHNRALAQSQFSAAEVQFTDVVSSVKTYPIPALQVYQAKDVYQEILATPEEILERKRPERIPLVTPTLDNSSLLEQPAIKKGLTTLGKSEHIAFNELVLNYRQLHEKGNNALLTASSEEDAGKILLEFEQKQKELALKIVEEPYFKAIELIIKTEQDLLKQAERSWDAALELANQGPEDPALAQKWQIEKQAQSRPTLTKVDLMSMYCRADVAYTVEKTGLDTTTKAQQLQNLIHTALVGDIQAKLVKNVNENLKKAGKTGDANYAMKVLDVLARESIPGLDKPATVIIQHEEDILLRTRQVSALKALLERPENGVGFKERIEKIIPGGGKSKVILPILAEEKAQGDNLVIIEVPPALLATNHVDFNRTSQRLFGKRAYRFEFNRDSNSSAARLEQLYRQFTEVMTTRSYLVTTGDAMQSLELKYIELLRSKERDAEWKQQVYWCDKLTGLLRNYGDCIIDEVHQGLWLKKKLNYTSGEPKPLSPALIKNSIALFNLIDLDFIKKAPQLPDSYNWAPFKNELANKLLATSGPLHQFADNAVLRYGPQAQQELIAYLEGKAKTMPAAVINATPEEKATLAFFKRQVSELLSETLRRKLNANYGASKRENLSPIEYTLAIPYVGNNVANEQSRFGNELEAINLTTQMMLIKGLSIELFKERILEWQALARQELFQNPVFTQMDQTPTARGFALLEKENGSTLTLSQINVDDPQQMSLLFERHRYNRSLIFPLLQERSLKQIHHDGAIIPSDSFNHVDLYRSVQGVSGTPSNHTTFHQRLSYDPKSSFGSDDYIVELLRSKKTRVSTLNYENVAQFVEEVLTKSAHPSHVRAIIDINATFTGVSNLDAAKTIASFIQKKLKENESYFSKPIKQVLYFNDDQVLCALDISSAKTIVLGTSDEKEINRLLRSTPEERFTYYDQAHTLGTDITQFENAHGIVLADEKDSFQGVIQGNMRFRGISQAQTLEFILPTRLNLTLDELIERLKENDKKTLWLDNLFATKAQMANLLRRTALSLIQDLPSEDAEHKAELAANFEEFFVDTPSLDLFALYGAVNKKQALLDILGSHKKQLFALWNECRKKANLSIEDESGAAFVALETIIKTAVPYCLPEYDSAEEGHGKEVQVQKEVQKQVQVERIALNACFNPKLKEKGTLDWVYSSFKANIAQRTSTLNAFSNTKAVFSDNLHVSINYAETYVGQKDHINVFMKPVFLVWYHLEGTQLHATIITPQEAEQLASRIESYKDSWIATTQDTVFKGTRPAKMLDNKHYLSLREQVRFFNGEFSSLLNQESPLTWLQEESVEKISFFENNLQAYRPGCEVALQQLKTALTQGNIEGLIYISEHPFEDLTKFNWKTLFPKTIATQAAEYQKVAQAFVYLNQNALVKTVSVETIQQQFNLPINSLGFIEDHIKNLTNIKKLFDRIRENPNKPFLTDQLTEEEKKSLEKCLGMPLSLFCEQHNIKPSEEESVDKLLIAGIEALHLMSRYPALQGNETVMHCFEVLARDTKSPQVLSALLKTANPSETLIANIVQNDALNNTLINTLLDLPITLHPIFLGRFATVCQSIELIQKIIKRTEINTLVLATILQLDFLEEEQLLSILALIKGESLLEDVYNHKKATDSVRIAVYKHPALSNRLLMSILPQIKSTEDLVLILQHPTAIDAKVLEKIVSISTEETVLLAVISHPSATYEVIRKALNSGTFSPAVALNLITFAGEATQGHALLKTITEKIFAQYPLSQPPATEEWEDILVTIFKKYEKSSNAYHIMGVISQNQKSISPRLGISILKIFGPSMLQTLPLKEIIEIADEETLNTLVDYRKTGKLLSDEILLSLAKACQSKGQPFIDSFLARMDLSEVVLKAVLKNPDLQERQLLLILQRIKQSDTLQQVYQHPGATNLVHQKIFKHSALSKEFVESLLTQKKLDDDSLSIILEHPTAVEEKTLELAVQGEFNSQTLYQVLSHPNATFNVMSIAVDSNGFSPGMAEEVITKSTVIGNHDLLQKLTKKTFAKYEEAVDSNTSVKRDWEKELANIFAKYSAFQNAKEGEDLTEIIKQHKEKLSSAVGITILRQFGQTMAAHLPFEKMINEASNDDLKILVENVNTGNLSEDLLIALAKKCQDQNVIQKLLGRVDITDKVLQTILTKTNLTSEQLVIILNKASDAQTLKLIFNHAKATNTVREKLYKHPALSPELVIDIFKNVISNSEVTQILQHKTAINLAVLKELAKNAFNSHVLLETVSHSKATKEVMDIAITNAQFSPQVAQKITVETTVADDHGLLQKLARKLFAQTKTADTPEAWDGCLSDIFAKYSKANIENASTDMQEIIKEQPVERPQLALNALRYFGKSILSHLPLQEMVDCAEENDVEVLLDLNNIDNGELSGEQLQSLAKKCATPDLISKLLVRGDLTANVLQSLFSQAPCYEQMRQILTHNQVTETMRNQWLAELQTDCSMLEKVASKSKKPEDKLEVSLERLKIKACKHALKAVHDHKYEAVATAALGLHQKLREEYTNYSQKRSSAEEFQHNCEDAIGKEDYKILAEHRGYKKLFVDIINVILAVLSIYKLTQISSGKWRFFEAKTASKQAVESIDESIKENIAANKGNS
ncbi:DUF3638 domain-containing protein [Legionella cardiaca]|uniref:DUF3638 domain-containing protein n=1 Tax=Legionella cardiaca TaxID=1071983 RepID=A0ABY8AR64_9GAMM|nr:DUF3638 domain-containing protein [Legionella cardiaca]WED43028.1 DUF3638 domain-containing protein [Legionella cardiaca]